MQIPTTRLEMYFVANHGEQLLEDLRESPAFEVELEEHFGACSDCQDRHTEEHDAEERAIAEMEEEITREVDDDDLTDIGA